MTPLRDYFGKFFFRCQASITTLSFRTNHILLLFVLFSRTELPSHAWTKYSLFDSNKPYTRNLISTDHETYTLLLLCWNPEQESPIHDHPCDGCWLQVLHGDIRENRYDRELNCVSEIDYREGELSYITDNVGYHKVANPTQRPSVTLHLYAPPFETCQCWHSDYADPLEPCEGKNVNHSEYGILKVAWIHGISNIS